MVEYQFFFLNIQFLNDIIRDTGPHLLVHLHILGNLHHILRFFAYKDKYSIIQPHQPLYGSLQVIDQNTS